VKLERHLFRELLVNLALAAGVVYFIVGLAAVLQASLSKGFPLLTSLSLAPLFLLPSAELLTPLALLLAVVFTYGRVAAENEYLASQACGVHPLRMLGPTIVIALLLSAGQLYISSYAIPQVWMERSRITREIFEQTIRNIPPGTDHFETPDGSFYMSWGAREGGILKDVYIRYQKKEEGETLKKEGRAEGAKLEIDSERMLLHIEGFQPFTEGLQVSARRFTLEVSFASMSEGTWVRDRSEWLRSEWLVIDWIASSRRLQYAAEHPGEIPQKRLERDKINRRRAEFVLNRRVAGALCNLVYALFTAPLAIWLRRGTRLGAFAVGIVVAFGGFALAKVGEVLEASTKGSPYVNAWLAPIVLGALALLFVVRLVRR